MKKGLSTLAACALALQLCSCGALIKAASHADDAAKVGKAGSVVADAGHVAAQGDEVARLAGRAGSEAAQTGEVASKAAAEAGKGTEAAQAAEVAGHSADAVDLLTSAYDVFEDSAEEDDGWEADEQIELEKATADLKKEAIALPALPPESRREMDAEVARLEAQVQKSAKSRKVEDMKEAGRLGTALVSKVSAIRSNATMETP